MLGHRALSVEDYTSILRRRWWLILIPAIIMPVVAIGITFLVTPKYESSTLVLIDQQKVPDDIVKPVVTEDLDSRIASTSEQILSRSSLQPIVEKYNLYADQRMTIDDRIDHVRKDITIQPIRSTVARSNGLPGFKIFVTANDPHTAQQVCTEITSLFTNANLRQRQADAEGTTSFLKEQLDQAKHTLDDIEQKQKDFEIKYFGMLPQDETQNVNVLNSLNSQLDSVNQQLQSLEQSQAMSQAMLAQQTAQVYIPGTPAAAPGVEQAQLDQLQAQEAQLSAQYTADYPDLKDVRRRIADLRRQMQREASAVPAAPVSPTTPSRSDTPAIQQLRATLRGLSMAIQGKQKQQETLQAQIHGYQARVQSSPEVSEGQKQLSRDYETAKTFYDNLQTKMNQSQMATDLEARQQGETFSVLDAANLPDAPKFPNRPIFAGGGLAFGVLIGLGIVALLEYRDTALRDERDVWAFTQLPTLAVIAWSAGMEEHRKPSLLKRIFHRKRKNDLLADAAG